MNWTNRSLARIGSIGCALALVVPAAPVAARGGHNAGPSLWFQGTRLVFGDSVAGVGDLAVASNDPGLGAFLARLGASIHFQEGQRYAVVTTADHRTITFTVGESTLRVDGVEQTGPLTVEAREDAAYIPFYALARALDVVAVPSLGELVLEPRITSLDAHEDHGRTVVMLHGALPLRPETISATPERVVVRYRGMGTSLAPKRALHTPGITAVTVAQSGTARNPVTTLTFALAKNAHGGSLPSSDPHGSVLAFAPAKIGLPAPLVVARADQGPPAPAPVTHFPLRGPVPTQAAPAQATPQPGETPPSPADPTASGPLPAPEAAADPVGARASVVVSAVENVPASDGYAVRVRVSGKPKYAWRVLADNRFYVDFPGASLDIPTRDDAVRDARVASLRVRSNGTPAAPNVRLALGLNGAQNVKVTSDATSLTVTVGGATPVTAAFRAGVGVVGTPDVPINAPLLAAAPVSPLSPIDPGLTRPGGMTGALFTPSAGMNPRLIVLDPGHGGSDPGAAGNGLTEKVLTLDIARRLRDVLTARGWQVMLTRDRDVDVYAPYDTAREELQARCDVANRAGARLFVSLHINSFTSSDLRGTTTYYYKPADARFAQLVNARLISALGTQDDGARRENFYVVRHTTMPAILVETAFISNPGDAAKLRDGAFRQSVAAAIGDGITAYTASAPNSVAPRRAEPDLDAGTDELAP